MRVVYGPLSKVVDPGVLVGSGFGFQNKVGYGCFFSLRPEFFSLMLDPFFLKGQIRSETMDRTHKKRDLFTV